MDRRRCSCSAAWHARNTAPMRRLTSCFDGWHPCDRLLPKGRPPTPQPTWSTPMLGSLGRREPTWTCQNLLTTNDRSPAPVSLWPETDEPQTMCDVQLSQGEYDCARLLPKWTSDSTWMISRPGRFFWMPTRNAINPVACTRMRHGTAMGCGVHGGGPFLHRSASTAQTSVGDLRD